MIWVRRQHCVTVNVNYWMPDYQNILQEFIWQTDDYVPQLPRVHKFMNFWYKEIDAVVIGKAPDFFEGVMMPELYLAEALGAVGKPILRVHTAGSVGGSTALVAASLIQSLSLIHI